VRLVIEVEPGNARHYDALGIILSSDRDLMGAFGLDVVESVSLWLDMTIENLTEEDWERFEAIMERVSRRIKIRVGKAEDSDKAQE
jgi:hypothetical protein